MLNVHKSGVGVCGVYTAEVAETKVGLVHYLAKKNGFPLKCSMEEA
jgi:ATP-dependent Clp protease adaptor protein ClpS